MTDTAEAIAALIESCPDGLDDETLALIDSLSSAEDTYPAADEEWPLRYLRAIGHGALADSIRYAWVNKGPGKSNKAFKTQPYLWYDTDTGQTRVQVSMPGSRQSGGPKTDEQKQRAQPPAPGAVDEQAVAKDAATKQAETIRSLNVTDLQSERVGELTGNLLKMTLSDLRELQKNLGLDAKWAKTAPRGKLAAAIVAHVTGTEMPKQTSGKPKAEPKPKMKALSQEETVALGEEIRSALAGGATPETLRAIHDKVAGINIASLRQLRNAIGGAAGGRSKKEVTDRIIAAVGKAPEDGQEVQKQTTPAVEKVPTPQPATQPPDDDAIDLSDTPTDLSGWDDMDLSDDKKVPATAPSPEPTPPTPPATPELVSPPQEEPAPEAPPTTSPAPQGSGEFPSKSETPSEPTPPAEPVKPHEKVRKLHTDAFVKNIDGAADLSDEQKTAYKQASQSVLGRMTSKAVERFHKGSATNKSSFHKNHEALKDAIVRDLEAAGNREGAEKMRNTKQVGACYIGGRLYLDGGLEHATQEGGDFSQKKYTEEETYAHEFTHAIDGPNSELSKSSEWQTAFQAEIQGGALTSYGASMPAEGFAEFGRLLLSGRYDAAQVKAAFPQSFAFWVKQGLVDDVEAATGAEAPKVEELFDKDQRVELGTSPDDSSHADVHLQTPATSETPTAPGEATQQSESKTASGMPLPQGWRAGDPVPAKGTGKVPGTHELSHTEEGAEGADDARRRQERQRRAALAEGALKKTEEAKKAPPPTVSAAGKSLGEWVVEAKGKPLSAFTREQQKAIMKEYDVAKNIKPVGQMDPDEQSVEGTLGQLGEAVRDSLQPQGVKGRAPDDVKEDLIRKHTEKQQKRYETYAGGILEQLAKEPTTESSIKASLEKQLFESIRKETPDASSEEMREEAEETAKSLVARMMEEGTIEAVAGTKPKKYRLTHRGQKTQKRESAASAEKARVASELEKTVSPTGSEKGSEVGNSPEEKTGSKVESAPVARTEATSAAAAKSSPVSSLKSAGVSPAILRNIEKLPANAPIADVLAAYSLVDPDILDATIRAGHDDVIQTNEVIRGLRSTYAQIAERKSMGGISSGSARQFSDSLDRQAAGFAAMADALDGLAAKGASVESFGGPIDLKAAAQFYRDIGPQLVAAVKKELLGNSPAKEQYRRLADDALRRGDRHSHLIYMRQAEGRF